MSDESSTLSSRRDFLSGNAARTELAAAGDALADELVRDDVAGAAPSGGDTVRLSTRAMACDFCVIMNPGPADRVMSASDALDLIHTLETQMTVYRDDSELSELNRLAAGEPVDVEPSLFELLTSTRDLCRETGGAFDPTSGPLIELWRCCRQEGRIPSEDEIAACREQTGIEHVIFDEAGLTVRFDRPGVELNLGGIGKGYALDRAGALLKKRGLDNWLFHGGHSSILAHGDHNSQGGWPVGLRNPLFTEKRLGTVLLKDMAMSTSGSNIQYFRHGGRRYGHILDPRSGQPAEELLSVTVLATTAALADALSTAFFVMGVENSLRYCDNHPDVSALLIPPPRRGRKLEPIVRGIPEETLFLRVD